MVLPFVIHRNLSHGRVGINLPHPDAPTPDPGIAGGDKRYAYTWHITVSADGSVAVTLEIHFNGITRMVRKSVGGWFINDAKRWAEGVYGNHFQF